MPIEQVLKSDIEEIVARLGDAAQRFSGKTVLLTGANGFLGRSFSELFSLLNATVLEKPVTLIGLDKSNSSPGGNESPVDQPHIRLIKHDVVQPFTWEEPLDFIIHAAGIPSPFYYRAYPLETLHISITGTQNMLELAQQHHARFVFFSSSEIYGDPDPKHVPMAESYSGNVSCQGPRAYAGLASSYFEKVTEDFHRFDDRRRITFQRGYDSLGHAGSSTRSQTTSVKYSSIVSLYTVFTSRAERPDSACYPMQIGDTAMAD